MAGVRFLMFSFSLFTSTFIGRSSPFLETKVAGADSKVSKLKFYVQEIAGDADQTVYKVARPSSLRRVEVINHRITAGPDRGSAEVGRLQGTITTGVAVMAFAASLNFNFTAGEYSDSSVRIAGWVEIDDPSRELRVAGGTGLFRSATGYALGSTYNYGAGSVLEFTFYIKSGLQNIARDFQ